VASRPPRVAARARVLSFAAARPPLRVAGWFVPSPVVLAVVAALALAGAGAYVGARKTAVFAIEHIEVTGADPAVTAKVQAALQPLAGTSLVGFGGDRANRRLVAVPEVALARYDRDFPHTLRVVVQAERPLAVIRRGRDAWLVSARGRVLRELRAAPFPALPRVWVQREVEPSVGATIDGNLGTALAALRAVRRAHSPLRVRTVRAEAGSLTLVLASGTVVLLGDAANLALKLAVARRVLALNEGVGYVDVSVPQRAVTGALVQKYQVESES
jgi:cell division protein FtsQ